jgi:hypothetical protein
MPEEYYQFGHMSDRTDAFAFGICLIELLTNLKGRDARALNEQHDDIELAIRDHPATARIGMPRAMVAELGMAASRLLQGKARLRSTISAEMVLLEQQKARADAGGLL